MPHNPKKSVEITATDINGACMKLLDEVMESYLNLIGNVPAKHISIDRLKNYLGYKQKRDEIQEMIAKPK